MIKIAVALSISIAASGGTLSAQSDARLTGVVRDTHGTPQMGVTVELLGPVMATALTDLEGRYQIRDVLPGIYQLRASATLYVPHLQRQLRLAAGRRSVVNLTMVGLLDQATWMSTNARGSADGPEDWKWTLRSPANRPLLRLADKSSVDAHEEGQLRGETHAAFSVDQRRGGFGDSGDCERFSMGRLSSDQRKMLGLRASSCNSAGSFPASMLSFATALEDSTGASAKRRFSSRVRTFPQLRSASGTPLTEVEFASAEQLQLGDLLALQAGSETQLLSQGSSLVVSHPFLRVSAHAGGHWAATYSFATATGMSQFDDLSTKDRPAPAVIRLQSGLDTEAGMHHELAAHHNLGRGTIEVAYHHDVSRRTAVSGVFPRQTAPPVKQNESSAILGDAFTVDATNGTFRTLAPGFTADGSGVVLSYPVNADVEFTGGYLTSTALALLAPSSRTSGEQFSSARSEALFASVNGKVRKTGTKVTASYRWQPARVISVLAPYDANGLSPYLSVHLRQSVPRSHLLPPGAEITLDGSNVLREGYQPDSFASQQALLASALQELRAGITFTF